LFFHSTITVTETELPRATKTEETKNETLIITLIMVSNIMFGKLVVALQFADGMGLKICELA